MKTNSQALKLNDFTLRTVEDNVDYFKMGSQVKVVKLTTLKNADTNNLNSADDPTNWDLEWFNNYE